MRIRSRVEALERRASPTGECECPENRSMDLLLCRDPSVPPPPLRVCGRCGRGVRRVILGPVPRPEAPAYEPLAGIMDYYQRTVQTAYEPATNDTIFRMMGGLPV